MDITSFLDAYGEKTVICVLGLAAGLLFGVTAQRSRFCLRSAVIEFWRGTWGEKLSIWLLAFSAAVVCTQAFVALGWLDVSTARQLSARGSISGALVGGLMFGVGMILTRGCSSRILILAANGNLRALLSGLIFAVTAQAAMSGALAPMREAITGLWTVEGGAARDLLAAFHVGHVGGIVFGCSWLVIGIHLVRKHAVSLRGIVGAVGVGLAVALSWLVTFTVGRQSFDPIPTQSLSFTGPSADMLMLVLVPVGKSFDFDTGLLPGVAIGSFLAALFVRELKLEGFKDGPSMRRYIAGGMLMGFGGMLAGGCAVGNGVSGASVFSLTAWIALLGMWVGAGLTDWWFDRRLDNRARLAIVSGEEAVPVAP
jgi:uncharacterized membrane protein YedE/YeeE